MNSLYINSSGTQDLSIAGTDGRIDAYGWPADLEPRRNWRNSPTEDSIASHAETNAPLWQNAGTDCSL